MWGLLSYRVFEWELRLSTGNIPVSVTLFSILAICLKVHGANLMCSAVILSQPGDLLLFRKDVASLISFSVKGLVIFQEICHYGWGLDLYN